jgi:hypothetical protein
MKEKVEAKLTTLNDVFLISRVFGVCYLPPGKVYITHILALRIEGKSETGHWWRNGWHWEILRSCWVGMRDTTTTPAAGKTSHLHFGYRLII